MNIFIKYKYKQKFLTEKMFQHIFYLFAYPITRNPKKSSTNIFLSYMYTPNLSSPEKRKQRRNNDF